MGSAFVGFLSDMSSRQINHLYQSPWACLSVLRSLPSLAKHYVMRLLYVDEGVAREEMDAWVRPGKEHRDRHARAMSALKRLRVLVRVRHARVRGVSVAREQERATRRIEPRRGARR